MTEIETKLSQLAPLWLEQNIHEDSSTIDIDVPVNDLPEDNLEEILRLAHEHGEYFSDFEITFQAPDAGEQSIIQSGSGLRLNDSGFDTLIRLFEDVDVQNWRQITSDILHDDDVGRLAEFFPEWTEGLSLNFHVDCILDKAEIGYRIESERNDDFSISVFFWSNEERLRDWLNQQRAEYVEIAEEFFDENSLPVFAFYDGVETSNSHIPLHSVDSFINLDGSVLESQVSRYLELMDRDRDILQVGPELSIVSPSLFNTTRSREIFEVVFVYSVLTAVAERARQTSDALELEIKTRRKTISEKIGKREFQRIVADYSDSELTVLYEFYEEFIEKGTRNTYQDFWHRSIAEECDSFRDLPRNADAVQEFYTFLEEEAIEKNFDDLNDAIQDAHVFTADVTSTVSETTRSLTSEIQTVVLSLLGALFANLFLVVRWSNVHMVLPFSIFVISGVLLFYFPTIQARIEELDDLISESNDDFEVYSETIQEFSGHLFDFESFDERRESYVEYAEDRRDWAVKRLQLTFYLLITIWAGLAAISLLGYPRSSGQFLVAGSSVVIAGIICYRHREADYHPHLLPPVEWGPSPTLVLIVLIGVIGFVRLFYPPISINNLQSALSTHLVVGLL